MSFALDKPEALRKFLAEHSDFGVMAYPVTTVIDRQGRFTYGQEYADADGAAERSHQARPASVAYSLSE